MILTCKHGARESILIELITVSTPMQEKGIAEFEIICEVHRESRHAKRETAK